MFIFLFNKRTQFAFGFCPRPVADEGLASAISASPAGEPVDAAADTAADVAVETAN